MLSRGTRLGPYEIVSPLGTGGMGEVYRARDVRLGREVAVKVLPAELSEDAERLRRFEAEARAASALNHPNIVVIHDVGRSDSISYIAMECIEGRPLRGRMESGPLPVRGILGLAVQIAEGLAKAHSAGIVHRDLKPENVMVTEDGLVKILDFGLARMARPSAEQLTESPTASFQTPRTEAGVVLGTVGYMSPEQAAGHVVDHRSDQFSFGAILYEMATGHRPFRGDSAAQTLTAIIEKEPPPVATSRPDAPAPLVWVIERCLSKAPQERYESTRDLARDLANLRDRLSSATSQQALQVFGSPVAAHRRRLGLTVAAALAGAGLAAAIIAGVGLLPRTGSSLPSLRQLTFRAGTIGSARFAPDGETIVYTAAWEGRAPELFLVRRGSTESRPLGLTVMRLLSISRSGEMAVLLGRGNPLAGVVGTLARVALSGGAPRELLGNVSAADWTPEDSIVAVTREKGRSKLWFPIGHKIYESRKRIWAVCASPKGDRVACLEGESNGTGDVVVFDRSGNRKTLSRGWVGLFGLAWSPDGREIRFTGTRGDAPPALHGVSSSGKERVLFRAPRWILLADVFRDGSVLLVNNAGRQTVACLLPGDTRERQLGWLDGSWLESLSRDGQTLLFTERRLGGGRYGAAYLRNTDGSPAIRLGEGSAEGLSPDGKWALLTKDYRRLTILPTGPGSSRTLASGKVTNVVEGQWLDERRIVFSGRVDDRPLRVYIQDVDGGDPQPLTPEGVSIPMAAVKPDHEFVLTYSEKGWFLYPVEGGTPRPVPGLVSEDDPVGWSADGERLYVRREQDPASAEIEALELASGRRRPWKKLALADPSGAVRIYPIFVGSDEKSYCYTYDRVLSTLHLVEGIR